MATASLTFCCLLATAFASPFAQFSLPPLIPETSIPGFPGLLSNLAPPLPVLQVPTPALPSPPFQGSDIKPKKIGYFWTGAGDNNHAGMLSWPLKIHLGLLLLRKSFSVRLFGSLQS